MARAFSFRLDQVLVFRRQLEEIAIRKMARTEGELLKVREDLEDRRRQKADAADRFSGETREGVFEVERAVEYNDYFTFLSGLEKRLKTKEEKTKAELEKCRGDVVKAAKKRRLLEGLKEKRFSAHQAEVAKEEQEFLDDISSIAFIRRGRASRARRAF